MLRVPAFLLLATATACTYASGDSRVFVTSEPPGAVVLVDGADTRATTPAVVDLGGFLGGDHEITLQKAGYTTERRAVRHHRSWYTSRWNDGADALVWRSPFWWTLGDWFTPFAVRWRYVPHELHVVLYREGEGPMQGTDDGQ